MLKNIETSVSPRLITMMSQPNYSDDVLLYVGMIVVIVLIFGAVFILGLVKVNIVEQLLIYTYNRIYQQLLMTINNYT